MYKGWLPLMFLRSLITCSYLMAVYWASTHFPSMKMVFYPTLGAFSFLFLHRGGHIKDTGRIIVGAIIAVTIGSIFYNISTGVVSFFATAIITISLIQLFKWNAAPILAVSLIPYFAHPVSIWMLPLAVLISLIGLLLPLWLAGKLEQLAWLTKCARTMQLLRGKITSTARNILLRPDAKITQDTRNL
jgi:hypothetical protein